MRLFEKWLWSLLMVGLLCATAIHTQDDLDEDMEDEEEEETTVEEERPAEVPVERPVYVPPVAKGNVYLTETFESEAAFKRWVISQARKEGTDDDIAKYDGQWSIEEPKDNPLLEDLGLVLKSKAKHHAVAVKLSKQFDFTGKPFIVQYEVKFQNGQECGGAYVKLLSPQKNMDLTQFHDKTPYTIMFGPDKCGNDNKLHFIFRHKNPKTGEFEEKHAKKPSSGIDTFFTDKKTHLFTLVVNPDNTFQVLVDQKIVSSGSLLEDVDPPVNPAKEIVDPDDKKPEDWDEREKIPDPEAKKPEDWDESEPQMIVDKDATMPEGWLEDEPELIPDPDADKPTDWDEEMDGEWEAPMISNPACESAPGCGDWEPPQIKNPKYKGKWKPPMIDNPNYQGKWKPRNIPNPDYFEDLEPHKMTPIVALGLELWSMSDDLYFDNFIITDDKNVADQWAADSWELKIAQEMAGSPSGKSVVQAVMDATNERPWLWAVFILVVVLPIVLVFYYCCVSGSKPEDIARIKKTDEASPDDAEEEEDEQEEEDKGGSGDASSAKKASKSALEADADAEDDEAEPEERRSSPRKRKTKPQKE